MSDTIVKARMNSLWTKEDSVTYCWQHRIPFDANGTLTGTDYTYVHNFGQLPAEWVELYKADRASVGIAFLVRSYQTPIAWVLTDGTVVKPDVWYSGTTSKHAGRLWDVAADVAV